MNVRDKLEIQLFKKNQEIKNSSGFYALLELNTIRTSYFIFSENYRNYSKTLKCYYSVSSNILNNSVKRWHRQKNVIKDIHNVVSSAKSYVDHLKQIECTAIAKKRVHEFEREPLFNFIRALRNFLVHREPLYLSSRIENHTIKGEISTLQYESFKKQTFEAYLEMRSVEAKKSYDRMALEYLKNLPEIINLNLIFSELKDLLSNLHSWFVLNYVNANRLSFKAILAEIDNLNNEATKNKLAKMHPITQGQYRYILHLLCKAENTDMQQLIK